jgi:hypothetical protein
MSTCVTSTRSSIGCSRRWLPDARPCVRHEEAEFVWHKDTDLKGADVVILPGGFSHGDYRRAGAITRFSPAGQPVSLGRG